MLQRRFIEKRRPITNRNNIYINLCRNKTGAQTNKVGKIKEVEKIKQNGYHFYQNDIWCIA